MAKSQWLAGAAGMALAANAGGAAAQIDEIVVSAQKREQSLQEVGVSVTAFAGETLERLSLRDSTDIAQFTPNLEIGDPAGAGSQPAIFIRGVGLNDFNTNNAGPNGVYVDEVYISSPAAQVFQLFDLDRVEVLRGPQGTLYGRNTTGGAVNFIAAAPSAEPEGYLRAGYSSFGTLDVKAAASGPVAENVRARIAVAHGSSDGYVTNLETGGGQNGSNNWSARLLVDADPTERLSLRFNVHGGRTDTTSPQYRSQGLLADPLLGVPCAMPEILAGGCADALGYVSPAAFREGRYDRQGVLRVDAIGGSVTAGLDLGSMRLTSISAYEYLDKLQEEESDASPNRLLNLDLGVKSKTFTQELRASGAGAGYDWVFGLYYLWEDLDQNTAVDLFRELRPLIESVDPAMYPGGFDPAGASGVAPAFFSRTLNEQITKSFAAFGQAEVDVLSDLRLILGGRYTREKRDFLSDASFEEPGFTAPLFTVEDSLDNDNFSGKAALNYTPTENTLVYVSYSTGFKSGIFNGGPIFDPVALAPVEQETLAAYEIGAKTQFFANRLRLNGAAFLYNYEDLQVFTLINSGGVPVSVLDNAADASIKGGELELVAAPVDDFNISLGLGYLDTELEDFEAGAGADFSGNRLPLAPKWSFSGVADYTWRVKGGGAVTAQGSFSYRDDVFFSTENNPLIAQDGYWLLGARLQYVSPGERWRAAVYVENAADEDYLTYAIDLSDFGFNQQMIAPGRRFGGEIGLNF